MKGLHQASWTVHRRCTDQGGGFLNPSLFRREQEPRPPSTTGQKTYVVIEGRPGSQPVPHPSKESGQGSPEPVRTTEVRVFQRLSNSQWLPNSQVNSVAQRERHPVAAESDMPVLFPAC